MVSNIFGPYDARLLRRSFVHLNQPVTLRVGATSGLWPGNKERVVVTRKKGYFPIN